MGRPERGPRFLSANNAMGIVQGYQSRARREFTQAGVMLPDRIGIPAENRSGEVALAHFIVLENVHSKLRGSHSFGQIAQVAHSVLSRLGREKLDGKGLDEMISEEAILLGKTGPDRP